MLVVIDLHEPHVVISANLKTSVWLWCLPKCKRCVRLLVSLSKEKMQRDCKCMQTSSVYILLISLYVYIFLYRLIRRSLFKNFVPPWANIFWLVWLLNYELVMVSNWIVDACCERLKASASTFIHSPHSKCFTLCRTDKLHLFSSEL